MTGDFKILDFKPSEQDDVDVEMKEARLKMVDKLRQMVEDDQVEGIAMAVAHVDGSGLTNFSVDAGVLHRLIGIAFSLTHDLHKFMDE